MARRRSTFVPRLGPTKSSGRRICPDHAVSDAPQGRRSGRYERLRWVVLSRWLRANKRTFERHAGWRNPTTSEKVADKILFGKYSGTEVKVDGDDLLVMREEDIMAVIEGK